MKSRSFAIALVVLLASASFALAQAPTPTPVDSNVAVTTYAQTRGVPCSGGQGSTGCGGCYPEPLLQDPLGLAQLAKVNSEWAPIGPMISGGPDTSLPPSALPVRINATVALTKINVGGDFPGSHITDDTNTFIIPDPADNGWLATGNNPTGCSDEGCNAIEMEWEIGKYPLFAWAGEGDRITALGRWIFDCGHPDPAPLGKCSLNAAQDCITDKRDCVGACNPGILKCSNAPLVSCTSDSGCPNYGTCTNPAPNFNYRAELHPPQAVVVLRNKSIPPGIPASRADVYISSDGGAAGDSCTVEHLTNAGDVLFVKSCFQNHCSVTTDRSCKVDKDCAGGETCIVLDPAGRLADINTSNFEFDMPLPVPVPPSAATATGLKIKTKKFKPKGGLMPKPIFGVTPGPTPNLHVTVPMAVPLSNGMMPNVFAERITAGWIGDTTALKLVQVKFKTLTINNPLKASTPAIPRKCTNPSGGFTATDCTTDADCPAGFCSASSAPCHTDKECAKTDFCSSPSVCLGGIIPGWEMFGEVNGDWVRFKKLETLGGVAPFAAPPYVQPSPIPLAISEHFTFNEFVPSTGSIHLHTTGHSLNCIDLMYGDDLKDDLHTFGLFTGGACLQGGDLDPGIVDITHTGPNFATTFTGATCGAPTSKGVATCTATSSGGDGGTCSTTIARLCVEDADCPSGETCNLAGGGFTLTYTIQVK